MTDVCPKEEFLSAYLDNALSVKRMDRVRLHLSGCQVCQRRLSILRQTDAMLRNLPSIRPSAGFGTAFWAKVDQLEQARQRPGWMERLVAAWRPLLAAGLTAGLVAAFAIFQQVDPEPSAEEMFVAENMELLSDFELLQRLELFENWEAISDMKEQG